MPKINQPAPFFSLPALDGRTTALEGLRGQIVVLNFWSAECPWAARTDALLGEWQLDWGEKVRVVNIASNVNEDSDLLQHAARERGLACVLIDANQQVADLYQAQITPQVFVIDEAGLLRYQGGVDDVTFRQRAATRFYLREAVDALLAKQAPPLNETAPYGCTINRYKI